MREHHLIIGILTLTMGLAAYSMPARADRLEGLDNTMQVLDDVDDLDKRAAYLRVPDENDGKPAGEAEDPSATDDAGFDDEFEHDVEFEEDLMQDEDDFEDGDDVDEDRISATTTTP